MSRVARSAAWRKTVSRIAASLLATTLLRTKAFAQESQAEEHAREQAEKATDLEPYSPRRTERVIELGEQLLINPPPLYPFIGSVYPGGLAAAGPGVRIPFGDTGLLQAHAAWSLRNYRDAEARLLLPELFDRRLKIGLREEVLD